MAPVEQDQPTFLPPTLGDLIPENDRCRVVNAFGDCLPLNNGIPICGMSLFSCPCGTLNNFTTLAS